MISGGWSVILAWLTAVTGIIAMLPGFLSVKFKIIAAIPLVASAVFGIVIPIERGFLL